MPGGEFVLLRMQLSVNTLEARFLDLPVILLQMIIKSYFNLNLDDPNEHYE